MTESKTLSHSRNIMLSDIINNITADPHRYGCHLWDHRVAGNILELSVKANYRVEPEEYRRAVIKIGRVLQVIDHQAVLSGQSSQIQSFPSFEESQLVALVRLHKFLGLHTSLDKHNGKNVDVSGTLPALLQSIASHHGLFFHKNNGRSTDKFENYIHDEFNMIDSHESYYSICTTTDNPFIWLKTGQWIERVRQLSDDDPSISFPAIKSSFSKEQRSGLNKAFDDCSYVQALVIIS